jgi:hypothetical protein
MKKTYKIVIVCYFLFLNCISFAQIGTGPGDVDNNGNTSLEGGDNQVEIIGTGPGDEDNNGGTALEGGDPPATPINSKLWMLIFLVVAYSFFLMERNRKIKKLN